MVIKRIARMVLLATAVVAALAAAGCRPAKAPVESPEPQISEWNSGLSIDLAFDVESTGDSVAVTTIATATNVTGTRRELCVNLHFVAGFQEAPGSRGGEGEVQVAPTVWGSQDNVRVIAESPWKQAGGSNCTTRTLLPAETFEGRFIFTYSKSEFAGLEGDVYVMCEVWFQTRVDIPNQSLTCDMSRFGFEKVPAR
ncbi:MAG: hypothetical protein PVF33_08835 [Candidatus Latescibacterota bacterium]|jgi:hypothetical protein